MTSGNDYARCTGIGQLLLVMIVQGVQTMDNYN